MVTADLHVRHKIRTLKRCVLIKRNVLYKRGGGGGGEFADTHTLKIREAANYTCLRNEIEDY